MQIIMALIEKQGYLADLHTMSMAELKELLKRQEKLVSNPVLVKRLPDNGTRIFQFIEKIKEAIIQIENVDRTADLFEKMAIKSESDRRQRLGLEGVDNKNNDGDILQQLAEGGNEEKIILDERKNGDATNVNEKILKKADKNSSKYKFRPNRTIRNTDVHSLTDTGRLNHDRKLKSAVTSSGDDKNLPKNRDVVKLEHPENLNTATSELLSNHDKDNIDVMDTGQKIITDHSTENKNVSKVSLGAPTRSLPASKPTGDISEARGRLRYRYDESLETQMYTGKSCCQKAQTITVQESVKLLENQQKAVQELQAKYAAEKLAERLHIKMEEFKPEGQNNLSYRDQDVASDSDDDAENMDYPD